AAKWETGEQVKPAQSIVVLPFLPNSPAILISKGYDAKDSYYYNLQSVLHELELDKSVSIFLLPYLQNPIGWETNQDRWALISDDRRILHEDTSVPDFDTLKILFARFGIRGGIELYRKYLKDHGSAPGIELNLACDTLPIRYGEEQNDSAPYSDHDEVLALEAVRHFNKVLRENHDSMIYMRKLHGYFNSAKSAIEPLCKPMLSNLESLLERKPSAENIWEQWLLWNSAEGKDRSLESLVERIKPSPLSGNDIHGFPISVVDAYLRECKKNGKWHKVSALLKSVWDREYSRLIKVSDGIALINKDELGDELGIHLIEAYLQEGKQSEANDIFKAVMELDGKFEDISKIVELAKTKGFESLAASWQTAHEK
ncbi:MAG: hypothetical protein LBH03_00405, partial [Holophagales bacterium]|nr:hypothetical protein [Holophagales bacterium]